MKLRQRHRVVIYMCVCDSWWARFYSIWWVIFIYCEWYVIRKERHIHALHTYYSHNSNSRSIQYFVCSVVSPLLRIILYWWQHFVNTKSEWPNFVLSAQFHFIYSFTCFLASFVHFLFVWSFFSWNQIYFWIYWRWYANMKWMNFHFMLTWSCDDFCRIFFLVTSMGMSSMSFFICLFVCLESIYSICVKFIDSIYQTKDDENKQINEKKNIWIRKFYYCYFQLRINICCVISWGTKMTIENEKVFWRE